MALSNMKNEQVRDQLDEIELDDSDQLQDALEAQVYI